MKQIEIEAYSFRRAWYSKWNELKNFPIYLHQVATMDAYDDEKNIVLSTKTGSGKTAAALFPLIKNGDSAIFVYPTNALIKNQLINIYKTLTRILNKKVYIRNESMIDIGLEHVPLAEAEVCLHIINREVLEEYSHRGEIIQSILHDPAKQTIVLTNPDTLFAMLALSYREHLNVVRALERYKTIVIDEFHMYFGVQLANMVFMLKFAEKLIPNAFKKKIFLSATSNEDLELLLINLFNVEKPKIIENYEEAEPYFALQPVLLKPCLFMDELPIRTIIEIIQEIKEDIKKLREANVKNNEYVPCVIIVNSVIDAIHIEEEIIQHNQDLIVCPYHGLMNKSERKIEESHIVVGTNAIEVGIDFQCSFLIFDAGDVSSFMQRFGRIGRHKIEGQIATAYSFLPRNLYECLNDSKLEKIDRDTFEETIKKHYSTYSSYSDFIMSDYGMLQANVFVQRLLRLLRRWGEAPDEAESLTESYTDGLYKLFEIDEIRQRKINRIIEKRPWFRAYLNSVSFRSTLPSVLVYDKREEKRGRIPIYETEVSTALGKGTPCILLPEPEKIFYTVMKRFRPGAKAWSDEDLPMVLIDDYDYQYNFTIATRKPHELYVPFICEGDDLIIQRKRENYGFGELFKDHIGMYIRAEDYYLTDWRIKKFKTDNSQQLLVFDGDALLYLSITDKGFALKIIQQLTKEPPADNII